MLETFFFSEFFSLPWKCLGCNTWRSPVERLVFGSQSLDLNFLIAEASTFVESFGLLNPLSSEAAIKFDDRFASKGIWDDVNNIFKSYGLAIMCRKVSRLGAVSHISDRTGLNSTSNLPFDGSDDFGFLKVSNFLMDAWLQTCGFCFFN